MDYDYYTENIRPINEIKFEILSDDDIRRMSVLGSGEMDGITICDLYDDLCMKGGFNRVARRVKGRMKLYNRLRRRYGVFRAE